MLDPKTALKSVTASDVVSAYVGVDGACCCGCSGDHFYSSHLREVGQELRGYPVDDEEVNDEKVAVILEVVKAHFDHADPDSYHVPDGGYQANFSASLCGDVFIVYLRPDFMF